jgi:hypothetical protein
LIKWRCLIRRRFIYWRLLTWGLICRRLIIHFINNASFIYYIKL